MMNYKPSKLGQTDLVLVRGQSSLVGVCVQDNYKSLYDCSRLIMICATVALWLTHRHIYRIFDPLLLARL